MEVFFHDVDFRATLKDVKYVFANVLHSPSFLPQSAPPWNFHVSLFPPKKNRSVQPHGGCGIVTVPQEDLGHRLLRSFGGNIRLSVLGRRIKLKPGKGTPRDTILEKIRHEPYLSPEVQQRREEIEQSFLQNAVGIHTVQLGWETRREVFSVEWEKCVPGDCHLVFDNSRREIRMKIKDQPGIVRTIAVHWSQVSWSATGCTDETDPTPTIFLSLFSPPVFDIELSHDILGVLGLQSPNSVKRQRLLELYPDDADLKRVLPYATLCIRLLCPRSVDLKTFKRLCKIARIPAPKDFAYQAEKLALFSETRLEEYRQWTSTLDWPVAFQLEALLRGRVADTKEVLSIRHIIDNMVEQEGTNYTANFLRSLADDTFFEVQGHDEGAFEATIEQYAENFSWSQSPQPRNPKDGIFNCLHVYISPTSMKLGGPFPERSNRVLRTYADNHDSFIRVSFAEENDSRYQHDREIDGEAFIRLWVSPLLRDGITVAGRNFNFLAYSQSALKSHTVWFMKDFVNPRGESINAATIIERLGNFDNLAYDPNLIRCPARYAARISQAFTTTDSSVSVPTDEIFIEDDIMSESGQYCFTDGVGTISSHLAQKIWRALQRRGIRATRKAITYPRAFQIRLVGAKGMLSVDHKLSGDVVILRRSMIKFDAPHSTDVEIAQPFVRPSRYYLNRPLIMILEGLGVPYGVFQDLQDEAVRNVEDAVTSLEKAANTLDQFGLAASYRVSSTLLHLSEIGISPRLMGDFYDLMLSYAIHHILRDLKHYARIPVDDGYTLVGVADIHGYLKEGEVFACVTIQETNSIEYLEGPVLVSRSPVIHPGDVQVVRAIGQPPVGSPFQKEPLMNTIVFSIHGS